MAKQLRSLVLVGVLVSAAWLFPLAQMRAVPVDSEQGHAALGLALRHLANTGIYMMATAHPDDENNGLLVLLNRGQGYRTALATATRGNGGQNEIGPELFEPLGVLRTEELAALHRFDGAEQYFTRAVDFGYTIDIDETLKNWGREEIIGDYVRLIRMVRPDVITAQSPTAIGPGQHAHHALAAILSHEAYTLAGDAAKYPEQIAAGLRPWQPRKFYFSGGFGAAAQQASGPACQVDLAGWDALLGRTYVEIGTEARSMHKCQGMAPLLALPGPSASTFQLAESTIAGQVGKDEKTLFDGVDTTIAGLARLAGPRAPRELVDGLNAIAAAVETAQKKFDAEGDGATLQPLLAGLRATRALRSSLNAAAALDQTARFEIDFRLGQKEAEFQEAILSANSIRVEALADDGLVVPGQPVQVSLVVANRGAAEVSIGQVKFDGFEADAACALTPVVAGGGQGGGGGAGGGRGGRGGGTPPPAPLSSLKKDQVGRCNPTLKLKADERITEPYWHRAGEAGIYTFDADAPFGLPNRPTPFRAQVSFGFAAGGAGTAGVPGMPGMEEVTESLPVQYRYPGNIFSGEKRSDLLVVPALSVRVSPEIAIIPEPRPASAGARPALPAREIRVTVVNDSNGAAESVVKLEVPRGWTAAPSEQAVKFTREDESLTVRFQVKAAPGSAAGDYHVKAAVGLAGRDYSRGYQIIEYPHIRRAHFYRDADATFKVLNVRTAPNLTIGYVSGSGDEVAAFAEQLGAKVDQLGADALAWGDLSHYKSIVLGVRAYERREDLRANNSRLLDYVRNGGTLIVLYNRAAVNDISGPYPAAVSNNRVTDERAPVELLVPAHPVFTTPNKITDAAWAGWVQERGLNFLGEKDSRYRDLVQLTDSFANNPGVQKGALVEATYGKGRWLYVGLGIHRELTAGVEGAYQLLANLISLGPAGP